MPLPLPVTPTKDNRVSQIDISRPRAEKRTTTEGVIGGLEYTRPCNSRNVDTLFLGLFGKFLPTRLFLYLLFCFGCPSLQLLFVLLPLPLLLFVLLFLRLAFGRRK